MNGQYGPLITSNLTIKGDPMTLNQKELAAAIAAVNAYILTEEQAFGMALLGLPKKERRDTQRAPWGQSGRRDMMQMRNMMQLRSLR